MRIIIIGLVALLSLSSCKLFKRKAETEAQIAASIIEKTQTNRLDYNTIRFSGRAEVHLPEGEMQNLSLSYRLEMVKGKEIQLVLRKFIEVARVHITPDSIRAIVPINNEAHLFSYDYVSQVLGQPADFALLERTLLGEFQPLSSKPVSVDLTADPVQFIEQVGTLRLEYGINRSIFRLQRVAVSDTVKQREGVANFREFEEVAGTPLPMNIQVETSAPQKASLTLKHRRAEANVPVDIRFRIPTNYTIVEH